MSRVIAVCGKGGVGKTTVSALATRHLLRHGAGQALVVDADHAGGLGLALGLRPSSTLEHIRAAIQAEAREGGVTRADLEASVDYQLLSAVAERGRMAFMTLGRPAGRGCYCSINKVLRQSLEKLVDDFDVTWIDAEAGVEQVNRDVIGAIDTLLLVTDPTAKGIRVAEAIRDVAGGLDRLRNVGLVVNRVRTDADLEAVERRTDLPILAVLPEDDRIRDHDAEERSLLELPDDSPAVKALTPVVERLFPPRGRGPGQSSAK